VRPNLTHPGPLQMLDQFLGDRLAVFHAGLVSGALCEALEDLALPQQDKGQAIDEVVR
jgi:hypothetical protein